MKWEAEHYKDFLGVLSVMSCAEKWNTLSLPVKICCVWYCFTLQDNCAFYHCIRNYFLINLEKHKISFSFSYQNWTCLSLPKYIPYTKIGVGVMRFSMSFREVVDKGLFTLLAFPVVIICIISAGCEWQWDTSLGWITSFSCHPVLWLVLKL